jgi:hypothetical protein
MPEGFILDADPLIPTGVPADPVQVGALVLDDVLPPEKIEQLEPSQQPTPEQLGEACVASEMPTGEAQAKMEDAGLTVALPDEAPAP